jgi:hypothetical protein
MSIRAWCHKHSVRESSFYWWRVRLARRDAPASALVPVRVTADSPATDGFDRSAVRGAQSRIEIVLPSQRRLLLIGPVDRQTLADVLAVLTSARGDTAEASGC